MREFAAAVVVLTALAIVALAPRVWPEEIGSGTLASATPTLSATPQIPPSWRGRDGGAGFVVCGSSDTWRRPSVAEENAHLAADPRYRDQRVDDGSFAATTFAASALLYDGAANSTRAGLATLSGLWADPGIGGAGCTSAEPQVWLFGYAPARYQSDDLTYAYLDVVPVPGYRMVVVTGAIRPHLVVANATKLAFLTMPANAITSTPTPLPKPALTAPPSAAPLTFPVTDRPVELALPSACQIQASTRHEDGLGAAFTVQCGSAEANLGVAVAAMRQGWTHLDGPPLGVGLQNYAKGMLTMQLAYRLDDPGYAAPFQLVQYSRPFSAGLPSAANPNAYLRAPTGFALPADCVWKDAPAGFTTDGAYKIPFSCPLIKAAEIQATFTRAMQSQGWRIDNGGFGFLTYARDNLRLNATFANEKAEPSETPWVVESLCCFGP